MTFTNPNEIHLLSAGDIVARMDLGWYLVIREVDFIGLYKVGKVCEFPWIGVVERAKIKVVRLIFSSEHKIKL